MGVTSAFSWSDGARRCCGTPAMAAVLGVCITRLATLSCFLVAACTKDTPLASKRSACGLCTLRTAVSVFFTADRSSGQALLSSL